jgi:hypothetical protein
MPPSIIGRTYRFDSKIWRFLKVVEFVSAYLERNKNFFRKIGNFHFLPSFFAEKWANNGGIDYQVNRKWVSFFRFFAGSIKRRAYSVKRDDR